MVLHYTFEKLDEDLVIDESSFNNNGRLLEGIFLSINMRLLNFLSVMKFGSTLVGIRKFHC